MNTISKKYIKDYITKDLNKPLKHDLNAFIFAIRQTAKHYDLDKKNLFHYIVERADTISMATSYGFDTRYGREIRQTFKNNYYAKV